MRRLPIGLCEVESDGRVLRVNPAFLRIVGLAALRPSQTYHLQEFSSAPKLLEENLAALARDGQPRRFVAELRRADGGLVPVRASMVVETDSQGVERVEVLLEDYTERKKAEDTARYTRVREAHLLSSLPIVLYTASSPTDLRLTWISENVERVTGVPRARFSADPSLWMERVHAEDRERVKDELATLAHGGSIVVEYRWKGVGGEWMWFLDNALVMTNADGRPHEVLGTRLDITVRKRAERGTIELARALENAMEGISRVDANGRFRALNGAFAAMFGRAVEEIAGAEWLESIHPEDRGPADEAYGRMLHEGKATVELRASRSDGRSVFLQLDLVRAHGQEDSAYDGFYGFARDVTERREAQELKEQLRQSQKMDAIGRLAGGVAHDFNNLLTVINGSADLVLASLSPEDPRCHKLDQIRRAGHRAADLTRQLLTFSRKKVAQQTVVDVNSLVARMSGMLQRLIGEDIDFTTALRAEPASVLADPAQLEQVLLNLVVNARDAMPKGGRLTIETTNVCGGTGGALSSVGSQVLLAVTDTGCGMDEATRSRIFEPFFTTKAMGTGLGLSIVYGIVRQCGGEIRVYGEPGRGTAIKLYLPVAVAVAEPTPEGPARPALPHGDETVLLVEDDAMVRSLAREMLALHGYRVLEAQTGAEALGVLEKSEGPIDLVLTDVVMPQMGGAELAERLVGLRPGLPVLFMSGYPDEAVARHGMVDAGANYLQKPFTAEALLRRVRDILDVPGKR